MTRVTNFGRKRKYLEAGFATDLTTTPSEHSASEVKAVDAGQGDSVHPKKRKRTKKPKTDGGDEQTPGGIEAEGETGVEIGKGRRPSAGQKKPKITKKRGGEKSGQLYFALRRRRLIVSGQALQSAVSRSARSNVGSTEHQIVKLTRYALRVAQRVMLPRTVPGQPEKAETVRRTSTRQSGYVTGLCFPFKVVSH